MEALSSGNTPLRAVVIGGGLAGMVVANELLKRNIPVLLLEKEKRVGGKAGADLVNGVYEEHGYHVFPSFYANTLALMDEIGATRNLVPITKFHYLIAPDKKPKKGRAVYPNTIVFLQPKPFLSNSIKNTFCGIIPWYEYVLFFYAMLDLCSQPFRARSLLDQVSVAGFLRSRMYKSEVIANFHQQTVLQASAIPNYDLSAMTMKHLVHNWCAALIPLFRILNGNLQEKFIEPLRQCIVQKNCEIRLNTSVVRLIMGNDRVSALRLASAGEHWDEPLGPKDVCVLATPLEVTRTFVTDSLYECEQRNCPNRDVDFLGALNYLESAPMAAFQLYFNRVIPNIPREHVVLYESEFGLSFVDVSQTWSGLKNTTLSVIASDFRSLSELSPQKAGLKIFSELQRFIPEIKDQDIERVYPQLNIRTPLFLNTVGAWHFRPDTRTRIENLYIAGDYCRSDADLTTMESAVISGRRTAASVLEDSGMKPGLAAPICLPKPYWNTFKVIKWFLWGPALVLRLVADVLLGAKKMAFQWRR